MPESMTPLIILGVVGALFILLLSLLTNNYSLNNIKSKTVGDGHITRPFVSFSIEEEHYDRQ